MADAGEDDLQRPEMIEAPDGPDVGASSSQAGEQPSRDDLGAAGGLPPDHPLLQRAQQALRKQLQQTLLDVDAKLREKRAALKVGARAHPVGPGQAGLCGRGPAGLMRGRLTSLQATGSL